MGKIITKLFGGSLALLSPTTRLRTICRTLPITEPFECRWSSEVNANEERFAQKSAFNEYIFP